MPLNRSRLGIDRHLLAYALINGTTFAVDIGLLTLLHGGLHWPLPLAISVAYLAALTLSFVLNRTLNFHSHAPVGHQVRVYVVVVVLNYVIWILGLADALAAGGLDYRLARLIAGGFEAVFMYASLRWIVFRDTSDRLARSLDA